MDFENNEKKQEETAQDGAQREYRPGRSPRPRIHTAARPVYERPSYRNNNDEGEFRPEGFGAGLQSNAPQRPQGGYRPRNNYNNDGGYGQQSNQAHLSSCSFHCKVLFFILLAGAKIDKKTRMTK